MSHALLIIDVQNDFLPGGALAVPDGDQVVPVINAMQKHYDLVVATQDWHPEGHGSFAATHGKEVGEIIDLEGLTQFLWPVHCVQGSSGAEFAPGLETEHFSHIVKKGEDPKVDSYSGFYDNAKRRSTGLAEYLRGQGVDEVTIVGLATDYCVKFSVLDALESGFKTHVALKACRGVNVHPGDADKAIEAMQTAGALLE